MRTATSLGLLPLLALTGCYQRYQAPECTITRDAAADGERGGKGDGSGGGGGKSSEPFEEQAIAPVEPHAFSIKDLLALDRIADARVSPDGARVVYTRRTTDLEQNRGRKDLWVVDLAGGAPVRISSHPENEDAPRWLPDSRTILFLQKHAGAVQVWQTNIDGASPTQVTRFPVDVDTFTISPDGQTLAFAAEVFPECNGSDALGCTAASSSDRRRSPAAPASSTPACSSATGTPGRMAAAATSSSGRSTAATRPRRPHRRPSTPTSRASRSATPTSTPSRPTARPSCSPPARPARASRGRPTSTSSPCPSTAPPRRNLTPDNPAWDTGPVFSPDGKTLAYRAMKPPRLRGRPLPRHASAPGPKDRPASSPRLGPLRRRAAVLRRRQPPARHRRGARPDPIFALDLAGGTAATRSSTTAPSATLAPRRRPRRLPPQQPLAPDELPASTSAAATRAAHRDQRRQARRGAHGRGRAVHVRRRRQGHRARLVVQPVDFDPAKKYPIAFLIHGGPQGSFGDRWSFRWNPQAYAGAGYASS
jgi:dipeptidyl aminopeptidase/acylaminoacyl peptidase